ncbi:MAG: arsenate reductase ArsC [Planctomycetota bacterium]|jgi:arsenate reductase
MGDPKTSVLFLCTANSARSLMAEAIANRQFADQIHASSAGTSPAGEPHPLALKTLEKYGVSTDGLRSKSLEEVQDESFDIVITLCDQARQTCPSVEGGPPRAHWHLPDPATADEPEDVFEAIYDALVEAMGMLVYGPDPNLTGRSSEAGRQLSRRFAPRAI